MSDEPKPWQTGGVHFEIGPPTLTIMIAGRPHYFEDRTRMIEMWRGLGVAAFQVAKGDF